MGKGEYLLIGLSEGDRRVDWHGENYYLVIPLDEDVKKDIGGNAALLVKEVPSHSSTYSVGAYLCKKPPEEKLSTYNVDDNCTPLLEAAAEDKLEKELFRKYFGDLLTKGLREAAKNPISEGTLIEAVKDKMDTMERFGAVETEEGYFFDQYLKSLKREYNLSDEDIKFLDRMFDYDYTPEVEKMADSYLQSNLSLRNLEDVRDYEEAIYELFDLEQRLPYDQLEAIVMAIEGKDEKAAIAGTCKNLELYMDDLEERFGKKLAKKIYEDLCVTKVAWE